MANLTDKQRIMEKIYALRKVAQHIGLIAPCKSLRPSEAVLAERINHYGMDFIESALMVVADPSAAPERRAAAGMIVECFIPDWRERVDPRLLGMVVQRGDAEVLRWRKEVLRRDDHTCTSCGQKERLEAHHIVRWADSPELRVVLDNGITLCHTCHLEEHHGA